jgi:hypothetical protein
MLISDSHEFIFVRVRKTASQSLSALLEPYALTPPAGRWSHARSRLRLQWDYRRHHFRAHDGILAAKHRMPAARFERYFKFAIVRNPWDRLVSEYEFILRHPEHGRHGRLVRLGSFENFIELQTVRRDAYQLNALCDHRGRLLVDYTGRLESLDDDWRAICTRIGIPHAPLPRINIGRHEPYTRYYTPELRARVAHCWAREIEAFGYTFGDDRPAAASPDG